MASLRATRPNAAASDPGHPYKPDWLAERVEFEPSGDLVTVYPHCGAGALISFRANAIAAKLYTSLGFVETGLDDDEFGEPNYKLAGAALDKHR